MRLRVLFVNRGAMEPMVRTPGSDLTGHLRAIALKVRSPVQEQESKACYKKTLAQNLPCSQQYLLLYMMLQPHPQRGLIPQRVLFLFRPVLTFLLQLDLKVPKHTC